MYDSLGGDQRSGGRAGEAGQQALSGIGHEGDSPQRRIRATRCVACRRPSNWATPGPPFLRGCSRRPSAARSALILTAPVLTSPTQDSAAVLSGRRNPREQRWQSADADDLVTGAGSLVAVGQRRLLQLAYWTLQLSPPLVLPLLTCVGPGGATGPVSAGWTRPRRHAGIRPGSTGTCPRRCRWRPAPYRRRRQ